MTVKTSMKSDFSQATFSKDLWGTSAPTKMSLPSSSGLLTKGTNTLPKSTALLQKDDGLKLETAMPLPARLRSTKPSKRLKKLSDVAYRNEVSALNIANLIATQIRLLREKNNMTQSDLAKALNTQQSAIARLEDPSYGKFTLKSIINIAKFFDVSVSLEMVSFSTHLRRTANLQAEKIMPNSYTEEFDPSTGEPLSTLDLHHDKSVLCITNYVTPISIDNSVFVSGPSAKIYSHDKLVFNFHP